MPDGLAIEYVHGRRRAPSASPSAARSQSLGTDFTTLDLRASPNGNGAAAHRHDDDPGRLRPARRDRSSATSPTRAATSGPRIPKDRWVNGFLGLLTRARSLRRPRAASLCDIQAQRLPIINIPGFAGSDILCGSERALATRPVRQRRAPAARCACAGRQDERELPGGRADAGPERRGRLRQRAPSPSRSTSSRTTSSSRSPPASAAGASPGTGARRPASRSTRLDDLIDAHPQHRHGEGAGFRAGRPLRPLLRRPARCAQYVDLTTRRRSQRVLTAGTPFWGAPKSLFFVSSGVENPLSGVADLDTFLPERRREGLGRRPRRRSITLSRRPTSADWLRVGPDDQDAGRHAQLVHRPSPASTAR